MKRLLLILLLTLPAQAANEVRAVIDGSPTAYYVIRDIAGNIWYVSGQVFEAFGSGGRDMTDYDVALVDKSGGFYVSNFDTNVSAGQYYVIAHQQSGGSPADADPPVWQEYGDWDGSIWTPGTFSLADIESEVNDALVVLNLDHLMKTAVANNADMTTEVTDGTVMSNIMTSDSDTSGYVVADDSLEALSATLVLIKAMTDLISINTTTVSDANDANSFTLTAGEDANDAYRGHVILVEDADDSHSELRYIEEWVSTRVVLTDEPFSFTPAIGDNVWILGVDYGGYLQNLYNRLERLSTPVYYYQGQGTSGGGTGGAGGVTQYDASGADP